LLLLATGAAVVTTVGAVGAQGSREAHPGAQIQPLVRSVMEDIERRRLQIDRIVPLHGQQVRPFAELQKDVQFWSGRRFTTTTSTSS